MIRLRALLYFGIGFLAISCQTNSNEGTQELQSVKSEENPLLQNQKVPTERLDSLDAVLQQEPNNIDALVLRGQKRMKRGDLQNALFDFQRVKEIDSTNADMLLAIGELYMIRNQSRQARDAWLSCANNNPQALECRINLGRLYASVQDYKPALEFLNQAIDIDEFNAEAHLLKGVVIRDGVRDTSLALTFIQRATELDQEYVEALDLMGVMLADQGDTLAPYYYKRILAINPDRWDIHYKMGVYYMDQDEINKAIEQYTKATQLNPYDSDSYYNLGYIFITTVKDYREAKSYFTKSIEAKPNNNYKAYYGRGFAFEMLGDVMNAEKDYLKSLEQLPLYQPAKLGLARIRNK